MPPNTAGLQAMRDLLALLPAATRSSMVAMYRESLDQQLQLVADGLAGRAGAEVLRGALHKLAGAAGMMQDQPLSAAARELDDAMQAGAARRVPGLHAQLLARSDTTREVLLQVEAAG
ncbi:Hpt domain-containing protein [Ramlibacter rhizophilus]|uniref:Hpt domain-containing protein n=1 Tax=Ramlibacter rhizophilus TaxID=1781167 RepID=A0A4Z0BQU2_9BURK|nr:Hpt domain-containing protein [Ramlibacter rhizophilus]TFZ01667.1 Hpt domain-containing protein [Ramlibacter rhizophilus]